MSRAILLLLSRFLNLSRNRRTVFFVATADYHINRLIKRGDFPSCALLDLSLIVCRANAALMFFALSGSVIEFALFKVLLDFCDY